MWEEGLTFLHALEVPKNFPYKKHNQRVKAGIRVREMRTWALSASWTTNGKRRLVRENTVDGSGSRNGNADVVVNLEDLLLVRGKLGIGGESSIALIHL